MTSEVSISKMFSSVRLVLTILVLSLIPKVITAPVCIPSVNSYLSQVQPIYSNFLTPNVNQPYNYIQPAHTYQQIYGSPIYQPYRGPYCLKHYVDPYKKLFRFPTTSYLQPGDSQFLFDVQQVYQMPSYRVSQTYPPNSNSLPPDFVGSQAPSSKTERDQGTRWNSRDPSEFKGKEEKLLNVATSSYVNSPQGTEEKSCIKGMKSKTSDNQQAATKNNKYSSNYSNEKMKRTEEKVSSSEDESENDPIDEVQYQKIMNYLKKQLNTKLSSAVSKTSKNDSRSNSINYSSKNMKDHTQNKNSERNYKNGET